MRVLAVALFPVMVVAGGWLKIDYKGVDIYSLGQLAGLVGAVLLATNFILATRWRWVEDLAGGLDKVYGWHHWLGATAWGALMVHPLFLVWWAKGTI